MALFTNLENEGKPLDRPEIREATKEEMLKEFSGWEDEVIQLLSVSGVEALINFDV